MSLRTEAFIIGVSAFLLILLAFGICAVRKMRRRSEVSWDTLFTRLQAVNRENIARIALDLDENANWNAVELRASDIWNLVGGMDGLLILEANCEVLIDMACYVQRSHPEALPIAEELRVSARQLRWHVSRLQGAEKTGKLESAFASYAQQAVGTYYRMTQSVLGLYEWTDVPEAAALKTAL